MLELDDPNFKDPITIEELELNEFQLKKTHGNKNVYFGWILTHCGGRLHPMLF